MSTIKSSAENLTLNADGSGNDIIFQSNGSNVATLDQAGLFTATSFAGSGANLTGLSSFDPDGAVVINESGADVDFRVEGSGETHALFVQGSDGKVGINTTTNIAAPLQVGHGPGGTDGQILISADNGMHQCLRLTNGGGGSYNNYPAGIWYQPSANMELRASSGTQTSNVEQITLKNDGNVGIGGSPGDKLDIFGGVLMVRRSDVNSSSAERIIAFKDGGNTERGSIKISNSAVTYTTGSDYRLKENVDYTWDATTRLKQLKPARFNFIVDDTNTLVDGFIAHEVSSVVPEAISGAKDALQVWEAFEALPEGVSVGDNKLDDDGNTIPQMQGIDQSRLVPLLVKTIQEMEARITALEG
jgi:hypothetical protein